MCTRDGNGPGGDANNYVSVAADALGTVAVAYFPFGNANSLTINLATFAGSVTARWFDPSNGSYSGIAGSPFANSGTHNFRPPGKNNAGDPDWVLLLRAEPTK